MVICLERGVDLHVAQLMSLPLTVSCFSKILIGFTFLVLAHPGSPEKGPLNGCVCVYKHTRTEERTLDMAQVASRAMLYVLIGFRSCDCLQHENSENSSITYAQSDQYHKLLSTLHIKEQVVKVISHMATSPRLQKISIVQLDSNPKRLELNMAALSTWPFVQAKRITYLHTPI